MMRTPFFTLLFPIALSLLAGCGQSGDLYRPDRDTAPPQAEPAPVKVTPAVDPAHPEAEQKKKEDEETGGKSAPGAASPPSTTPPTTP